MTATQISPWTESRGRRAWRAGILAGLSGGLAEIAWIALYQNLTGNASTAVARGVTQSVLPALTSTQAAVPLGLVIHMVLAAALGVAIAIAVRMHLPRVAGTLWEPVAIVGMLAGVWTVNFFAVLPAINPAFVTLVPYEASFFSKFLFGFAAAFVLRMTGQPSKTAQKEMINVQ